MRWRISIPGLVQKRYDREFSAATAEALGATDDWPYLNLPERSIGRGYLFGLSLMILIAFFFIRGFVWEKAGPILDRGSQWCFFLQGAGFMLLETNTITRMALILGSTWVVTSVAVILVLLAGLISSLVVRRFTFPSASAGIVFLAAAALMNYLVDIHFYLGLPNVIRVVLAAFQLYLPILASSLIFARLFQRSEKTSFDFGMNML